MKTAEDHDIEMTGKPLRVYDSSSMPATLSCHEFVLWATRRIKQCEESRKQAILNGDTKKALNYGARRKTFVEILHWVETHHKD